MGGRDRGLRGRWIHEAGNVEEGRMQEGREGTAEEGRGLRLFPGLRSLQ